MVPEKYAGPESPIESIRTFVCHEFVAIDFSPESKEWESVLTAAGVTADRWHKVRLIRCSHRGVIVFFDGGDLWAWSWDEVLTP